MKRTPHSRHGNRTAESGFTLIEIMVVIVILGLLATLASKNIFGLFAENQEKLAHNKVRMLHDSVGVFKLNRGRMPRTLEELTEGDEKNGPIEKELPKDPWNNDYMLKEGDRRGEYIVLSMGPDGQEGTVDDIRYPAQKN